MFMKITLGFVNNMQTKQQTVKELTDTLKEAIITEIEIDEQIEKLQAEKKKTHYNTLKAREAITNIMWDIN